MLTLHIEASDLTDMRRQIAAILGSAEAVAAPLADAPKRGRPSKAEIESAVVEVVESVTKLTAADTTTISETSPQTEAGAASAEAEVSDGELTYDRDIKPAILDVSANHGGREAVLKLLGEFNVDNASKLTLGQYPGLLAAVALLKG